MTQCALTDIVQGNTDKLFTQIISCISRTHIIISESNVATIKTKMTQAAA